MDSDIIRIDWLESALALSPFMTDADLSILEIHLDELEKQVTNHRIICNNPNNYSPAFVRVVGDKFSVPVSAVTDKIRDKIQQIKRMRESSGLSTNPQIIEELNQMTEADFTRFARKKYGDFPVPIAGTSPEDYPPEVLSQYDGQYLAPNYLVEVTIWRKQRHASELIKSIATNE